MQTTLPIRVFVFEDEWMCREAIQERTVANHVSNILFKINARNRTKAACIARRQGLLQ